jgi:hypothetical protein
MCQSPEDIVGSLIPLVQGDRTFQYYRQYFNYYNRLVNNLCRGGTRPVKRILGWLPQVLAGKSSPALGTFFRQYLDIPDRAERYLVYGILAGTYHRGARRDVADQ